MSVSVEHYLHTSFDGVDCEYVNGEIVERSQPDLTHSLIQARLIEIFYELRKTAPFFALPELRHKLAERRYRLPDVAVHFPHKPPSIPSTPPFIAIEIVSPDDSFSALLAKLAEYQAWGVPHIWVIDPQTQRLAVYHDDLHFVPALTLPDHPIAIRFSDLTQ